MRTSPAAWGMTFALWPPHDQMLMRFDLDALCNSGRCRWATSRRLNWAHGRGERTRQPYCGDYHGNGCETVRWRRQGTELITEV